MKNCDEFRELFGAYALGALDAKERAALEVHLAAGCKDCASRLAYVAPEAAPSDMLKGRLRQMVRGEAQLTSPPPRLPAASQFPSGCGRVPRRFWR